MKALRTEFAQGIKRKISFMIRLGSTDQVHLSLEATPCLRRIKSAFTPRISLCQRPLPPDWFTHHPIKINIICTFNQIFP